MSKERNIVKFCFEQHNRLSCIVRYNNTPKLSEESVAEHSYYVTFMAMLISDYLTDYRSVKVDKERLLKMALLHDMEEIISGDIIKVLKTGELKSELDKLNVESMKYLTKGLEEQGDYYLGVWKEAKEKQTLESQIIDLIDMMAVIIYCVKEIHLGNKYFKEILEYATKVVMRYSTGMPDLKEFIRELADYALGYLLEDKKIYDDINRAVRIYD